jgi:hypothetical protein
MDADPSNLPSVGIANDQHATDVRAPDHFSDNKAAPAIIHEANDRNRLAC